MTHPHFCAGTEGASPSNTVTGTPSSSQTPSATPTNSATRSLTATKTGTPSPTGTPSAYPVYGGGAFTEGNLVLLRVGDGVTTLSSTGAQGAIVEMDMTGSIVQTINLPTVSGVRDGVIQGSCTFYGTETTTTAIAGWANGIAVACYNVPIGATTYTATWRTVGIINHLGEVDTSTTFSMGSSEYFRGIATEDGRNFYLGGSIGLRYVAYGAQMAPSTLLSSGTVILRALRIHQGALYGAVATSPYGIARMFNSPLPTTNGSTITILNELMTGTAVSGSYSTAFHFDDTGSLYVAHYYSTGSSLALAKYTFNSGLSTWAMETGWPKASSEFSYLHPTLNSNVSELVSPLRWRQRR